MDSQHGALAAIGLTKEMTEGHGPASDQLDFDKGHFWENGWMIVLARFLMPVFMTTDRFRMGLHQMVEYLHMNGVTAINEPGIYWRNENRGELYQEILGDPDVPFESTFMVEGRTQPFAVLAVRLRARCRETGGTGQGDEGACTRSTREVVFATGRSSRS